MTAKTEHNRQALEFIIDLVSHQKLVTKYIVTMIVELLDRSKNHDKSKTCKGEIEHYCKYMPLLHSLPPDHPEYKNVMDKLRPAFLHHYEHNSHHPEHSPDGIRGMTLVDLIEMFCDWKAASQRPNGEHDFKESLQHSQKRWDISDDIIRIFENTDETLRSTA